MYVFFLSGNFLTSTIILLICIRGVHERERERERERESIKRKR